MRRDGGDRRRAGGLDDCGAVVVGQPVTQVGMLGEELLGRLAVGAQAGADEAVDVGAVVWRAAAHQQRGRLALAGPHRPAKRGHAPIVVVGRGVGSGGQEGGDDIGRGVRRRVGQRLGRLPGGRAIGALHGFEQDRHRVGVVGEDGGADRPGSGHHPGAVGEKQLQASVVAEAGRLADGPP